MEVTIWHWGYGRSVQLVRSGKRGRENTMKSNGFKCLVWPSQTSKKNSFSEKKINKSENLILTFRISLLTREVQWLVFNCLVCICISGILYELLKLIGYYFNWTLYTNWITTMSDLTEGGYLGFSIRTEYFFKQSLFSYKQITPYEKSLNSIKINITQRYIDWMF